MSDTTDVTSDVSTDRAAAEADAAETGATRRRRAGGGLASMLLPELQSLAASLGISGTARMRKGELVAAIQERQAATAARSEVAAATPRTEVRADVREERPAAAPASEPVARVAEQPAGGGGGAEGAERSRRASRPAGPPEPRPASDVRAAAPVAGGAPATVEPATEERTRERGERG